MNSDGIVIAGGGLAGQRCAETLRREGFDRPIRVLCAERHQPYDRPPLSKGVLTDADPRSPAFRAREWYDARSIELLLGVSATRAFPAERRVALSDGKLLRYDQLLIATGAAPRKLPALRGHDNVSELRTIDDALALRQAIAAGRRLAIVGAGFIGLEIAASARARGAEVTLIEAAPVPLAGVLGDDLGAWFAALHESHGVTVRTAVTVSAAEGGRMVRALRLSDGTLVAADHVVVGVGIEPETSWLSGSGVGWEGGVRVDSVGRTAADRVFAAGDAAARLDPVRGRYVAGSHWEAAAREGARVARMMLGLDPGAATLASFWTDQYGLRIQQLGDCRLADAVEIDGETESRSFIATFTRAGRAVAALLVDRPRSLPAVREMIEKGTPWATSQK